MEVRRVRPGERDAVLGTVVAAFRDDPQVRWYFPDDEVYEASAPRFFGFLLDTRVEGGEVWVADDAAAVAMWVPPGGNLLGPEVVARHYAALVADLPEASARRIASTDEVVDGLLPACSHWYLGVLATHPSRRGEGLGSQVLAPVLAAADRAGLPVALETSTPRNVAYYTRRGFAVAGHARVTPAPTSAPATGPADGLHLTNGDQGVRDTDQVLEVWVMRREPLDPQSEVTGGLAADAGR